MAVLKASALLTLASMAAAQSSTVVSLFFPGADSQTLVGSIVSADASQTTLAVACPSDADPADCGIPEPITVTVGPSTFHAQESFETMSVELDCVITGTTEATCQETYIGPPEFLETDPALLTATTLGTELTTVTTSTTLGASEIAFIPVTITAGLDGSDDTSGDSTTSASSTADESASSETASASASATGSGSGTPNAANNRDVHVLGLTAMGAALVGLTMMLL